MNDTSPEVAAYVAQRFAAMTGVERLALAAGMFETARTLVLASLPPDATPLDRRRHLLQRFYPELVDRIELRHDTTG